jgi:hypothetical protein
MSPPRPDLIVLHGDRIEALAGALVAATNYVRSAHVEGGEVSGTIDEVFRHCNTKLCTHHFVSSDAAARRVMALGEPPETIHAIGSPELDFHARPSGVTLDEVRARYAISLRRLWHRDLPPGHLRTGHHRRAGGGAVRGAGGVGAAFRGHRPEQRSRVRRISSGCWKRAAEGPVPRCCPRCGSRIFPN